MKRCPECEFLYENEQNRCDWCGQELKFTTFLPPLMTPPPVAKERLKSIWGGFTIPLLVVVLIGTVLVTLYRAVPPTFSSPLGLKEKRLPDLNQNTKPPASNSPQLLTAPETPPEPAEPSTISSTPTQIKAGKRPRPTTNEKVTTAVPATHIQMEPAAVSTKKPATSETLPTPPASQKPAASSYSISVHPEPPPTSPAPQSKTQVQEKESKFKSLLKKAGRVLKKPF